MNWFKLAQMKNTFNVWLSPELVSSGVNRTNAKKQTQLAYAYNTNNEKIIISNQGHAAIVRGKDKSEFEGGWIFPKQGKIQFYSGSLGHVSKENRESVKSAIENYLGTYFNELV